MDEPQEWCFRPRPYKKPDFLKSRLLENQKIFRNSGYFYTKMGFVGVFSMILKIKVYFICL